MHFLLCTFVVTVVCPCLPNSSSKIFRKVSIFIKLVISLKSDAIVKGVVTKLIVACVHPFGLKSHVGLGSAAKGIVRGAPLIAHVHAPGGRLIAVPGSFVVSSRAIGCDTSTQACKLVVRTRIDVKCSMP